ncbi:hydroxymethylglutaryl-CoA lyase [Pseudooctadecabacter sp.]|uniref:hydroxymethylglutaryl-CoA lyase n=1 Tax=Pseudooctadecabacter sp. TaxID=1966338 RepID=UPI0025D3E3D1|nr:hydroxymethylglutaryl-CoA lyase [Pseudooctadecabacter sp.]
MADHVTLFEMSPRDGLQNEARQIATTDKVRLVDMLSTCGFRKIEVTSFVSPKWVPQMADAAEVLGRISRADGVAYTALTPNLRGLEGAMAARADEVAVFASASEGFSRKNINCSIAESLERFAPVVAAATVPVRGYVSCVTDCPYDGPTPPASVARVAQALIDMGCYEVSLGDTIGHGTPQSVAAMLDAVLDVVPAMRLAGHFHDTKGRALDNIEVSLDHGLRTFDSSVAGLGGCPYAPGAKGNVATEAVVDLLEARGFQTGIDRDRLEKAAAFAATLRSDG